MPSVNPPSNLPVPKPHPYGHGVQFGTAAPNPSLGFVGGDPEDAPMDWRRVFSALWRYKWFIIVVPFLAAAGGKFATRYAPPQYVTQATIWINQSDRRGDSRGPFQASQSFNAEAWADLIRSFVVLDSVVAERRLWLGVISAGADSGLVNSFVGIDDHSVTGQFRLVVDPDGRRYSLLNSKGEEIERGAVGAPIGKRLGFRWAPAVASMPAGTSLAFFVTLPREAARAILDRLKVRIDQEGNFLKVELTGGNSTGVAATLNAIAEQYVRVAAELKRQNLGDRTRLLADQMKAQAAELGSAERALEEVRVQSVGRPDPRVGSIAKPASPDDLGADAPGASVFTLQGAMEAALRERQTIRRVVTESADSGLVVGELERLPSVQKSSEFLAALKDLSTMRSELKLLRLKYTDSHPSVIQKRSDITTLERSTIPEMARRVMADLSSREAELASRLATSTTELRAQPGRVLEEARLARNVSLAEGLYNALQQRYAEAQLAEASVLSTVRILDRAVAPQWPTQSTSTRMILLSFFGGLGLACVGALLLDRMDPKFRYPTQISVDLGLTILGAVPYLSGKSKGGKLIKDNALFQEALRGIRMNVEFAYGGAGPLILSISSAGSTDGKSFLAANLARSFADSGRRTLLIDGDLRRGRLHHRCSVLRRPGLTDCIRGTTDVDQVIQRSKFPLLDVVASGTRVHDAPELLSSAATAQIFGEFRSRYEVIICDSPPLAAGIDPFILASLTGNLLLVIRTGVSHREVLKSKVEVLGRMPIRLLGAVLNDVAQGSVYEYYAYYLPGYDTSDETGVAVQPVIF
jgi:succinoglycan biosynthesis transport protein ExoP